MKCTPTVFKKFLAYFWQAYVDYITKTILKDKRKQRKHNIFIFVHRKVLWKNSEHQETSFSKLTIAVICGRSKSRLSDTSRKRRVKGAGFHFSLLYDFQKLTFSHRMEFDERPFTLFLT